MRWPADPTQCSGPGDRRAWLSCRDQRERPTAGAVTKQAGRRCLVCWLLCGCSPAGRSFADSGHREQWGLMRRRGLGVALGTPPPRPPPRGNYPV